MTTQKNHHIYTKKEIDHHLRTLTMSPIHYFNQHSEAKVPFSWELKPGVSRQDHRTGEMWKTQWKLPPPPCLSQAASIHSAYSDVLQSPLVVCSFKPSSRASKSRESSFRKKEDDPFFEAFIKCAEANLNDLVLSDAVNGRNVAAAENYKKTKKKQKTTKKKKMSPFMRLWCNAGADGP